VEDIDNNSDREEGRGTEGWALLPGQRVQAKIIGQQPWGVFATIIGYEQVPASIDILDQFGGRPNREVEAMFPPIGTVLDAVVISVQRWDGPTRVRLSIRPKDVESLTGCCDFCREPVTLGPGGGGLILEVRSNDGPASHQIISHRGCLAGHLHPDSGGERARTLRLGIKANFQA
jgi:hypothetical protein